jgi:hypothetical protein
LKFLMPLKSIYNKNICFEKSKRTVERLNKR